MFMGDCSWTPMGASMLISNDVLSKWNVASSLLSCSSALSLTTFQPSHPPLWWEMWFHGLHLCLITATDGSVTGFLSSRHCSHSFPPFSYCQHTFTSKRMACTRLYLLLIPLHAIHMISAALFLLSLLPLQSQHKWGFGFDLMILCYTGACLQFVRKSPKSPLTLNGKKHLLPL